jgi:hypothetical protein
MLARISSRDAVTVVAAGFFVAASVVFAGFGLSPKPGIAPASRPWGSVSGSISSSEVPPGVKSSSVFSSSAFCFSSSASSSSGSAPTGPLRPRMRVVTP